MIIHTFPGPNFITQQLSSARDNDGHFITQESTTIMVVLESGMDIGSLEHKLDVQPGKGANLTLSLEQHPYMLDATMITPDESCEHEEVLNCTRRFLQEKRRKGGNILKCEATIRGDFEDRFVQPVKQGGSQQCAYMAVAARNPFRIANVMGDSPDHVQGIVLTTYLLHKLHRGTVSAMMNKPKYTMPTARSPGTRGGSVSQTRTSTSPARPRRSDAGTSSPVRSRSAGTGNLKRGDDDQGGGAGMFSASRTAATNRYLVSSVTPAGQEDASAGSPTTRARTPLGLSNSKKKY